jgi:hypothetical protein
VGQAGVSNSVSGFTITRTSAQRDQKRRRTVQKSRSEEFKGVGAYPFEDCDLLSQGENFQYNGTSTAQEDSDGGED